MATPSLNDPAPPARNPWDLERMPGGSSSGSAVALAAGLCAGSFGSDTGGSIRHPASHTAIVGLKPTYGLISRRGVIALTWSMDHVGPMARAVEDAALLLQAAAGHDAQDPGSANEPIPDYRAAMSGSARGVRIGVPTAFIESLASAEVLVAFTKAMDVLRNLGAEVQEIELAGCPTCGRDIPDDSVGRSSRLSSRLDARAARQIRTRHVASTVAELGFSALDYVHAQRGRALLCREVGEVMQNVDLIATPTMPRTAMTFAEKSGSAAGPALAFHPPCKYHWPTVDLIAMRVS